MSQPNTSSETTHRRIAVTGASGLIGHRLVEQLAAEGHEVVRLVRREPRPQSNEVRWDPARGEIDAAPLSGVDAIVNLAGEGIAAGRWTAARKAAIRDSRVLATRLIAECAASLRPRPAAVINASAIGYYGDRGDEPLTEESPPGEGFLPDVCCEWEAASEPARQAGIRVVALRIGVVLSSMGGALAAMLPVFRAGLGGRLGKGRQYMSWISHRDIVSLIAFALSNQALDGPVNAVAPQSVTNAEFTRSLGKALGRPTILPVPSLVVRLALGEMGRDLLLASTRVLPNRLLASGYLFRYPDIEDALQAELRPRE
jgi:uncharacterized protein (TIGR01777 family)